MDSFGCLGFDQLMDCLEFGREQHQWHHFGVGAPPILEPILVGIGMFTGGTIWILTHSRIGSTSIG